tara:strand:+ start:5837 stop:6655 length:819 start_codon:yes stop_codon:yes gene_type:complete
MNDLYNIKITDIIQGEKFQKLADNKLIYYCHTHDVNKFFDNINFTHDFILISHNSDGKITDNPGKTAAGDLLSNGESPDADTMRIPKNLKKWFGQNVNVKNDLIIPLPIGLENSYILPNYKKQEKLFNMRNRQRNIKNLVYLNFNIKSNPKERQKIYDLMQGKDYVTIEYGRNGLNYDNYIDNLYNHCFMICPPGNGLGVHQPWESLYIGVIPIQKKTINNSIWRDLPFCWVDSWEQLKDETFLRNEYIRITSQKYDLSKITFNYWKKRILN